MASENRPYLAAKDPMIVQKGHSRSSIDKRKKVLEIITGFQMTIQSKAVPLALSFTLNIVVDLLYR